MKRGRKEGSCITSLEDLAESYQHHGKISFSSLYFFLTLPRCRCLGERMWPAYVWGGVWNCEYTFSQEFLSLEQMAERKAKPSPVPAPLCPLISIPAQLLSCHGRKQRSLNIEQGQSRESLKQKLSKAYHLDIQITCSSSTVDGLHKARLPLSQIRLWGSGSAGTPGRDLLPSPFGGCD